MSKGSGKNSIILINGKNYSTYATQYNATQDNGMIDVTGFSEGGQNFIPGLPNVSMSIDFLADSTAWVGTEAVLSAFPTGQLTLLPEGYALGYQALSMPFMAANYSPRGNPASAVELGTINFAAYGPNVALETGVMLYHGTTTTTLTGTPVLDPTDAAVAAACGATLHIWQIAAADTYVIKVQHCATIGGTYVDLITFTLNGSALGAEKITVASGTINKYRRVLATRTGSAGNTLGFSVSFYHL